jgi:hypothetical protein
MDMHHKLRRDPTWHKDACNLCGQVVGLIGGGPLSWCNCRPCYRCHDHNAHPAIVPHPNTTQLGHQASNCTSGTVNWRQLYGDKEFIFRPPQYWSEELAVRKARTPNYEALEKQAREYAKVRSWHVWVGGRSHAPAAC